MKVLFADNVEIIAGVEDVDGEDDGPVGLGLMLLEKTESQLNRFFGMYFSPLKPLYSVSFIKSFLVSSRPTSHF